MSQADTTFDVAVIGLGPGGEYLAGELATRGLRVLALDERLVGGECPYYGCIPSKMMLRAADSLSEARRTAQLAGSVGTVEPDWSIVARRIRDEATDDWDDQVAVDRLTGKGATVVKAHGRIEGPGRVSAGGTTYDIERAIVLNTGTAPAVPPIDGLADVAFWTNRDFMRLEELPASLIVLGGGAIGCEMAQVAARFGVQTTIVEGSPRLSGRDEPEVSDQLAQVFAEDGIDVKLGAAVQSVRGDDESVTVTLDDGTEVTAERILVATGRSLNIRDVGLDSVGVTADRSVPVDDRCRVTDGVWAIGDITGHGQFTHVSMYEAAIALRDIAGEDGPPADYRALPHVTFTEPEIAGVGMTEADARKALSRVAVGSTPVPETTRGWIDEFANQGFIKVVADAERGVLVGATVMGPHAGEVIGWLAVAVHGEVPIDKLRSMIYAYPTIHRGIEVALAGITEDREA
ncbi:NAD(P)/FAD-dependent oxidoreductase [Flexivirga sp. ID2601S]|uniref:NAD(P)/FAD-dependent oxidoreductase n=1 Tax=Flexivirga aerilata TaxID=1656889 RepID=A0A849ANQ0_9MICO|nr:NAD(P)/FAD-dependent oxidoreductase [Flexivirga aerilata]